MGSVDTARDGAPAAAGSTDESRRIALAYLDAGRRGDSVLASQLFSPSARVFLPGMPNWGHELTRDQYFGTFAAFVDLVDGEIEQAVGTVVAEGNAVAAQAESRLTLKNGKVYNNHYHLYYEIGGGQIVVFKEYEDTAHFVECLNGRHALLGQPTRASNLFDDVFRGEDGDASSPAVREETRASVRAWLETARSGDGRRVRETFADDARIWVSGTPKILSPDEYVAGYDAFCADAVGELRQRVGTIIAEGTRATAQLESRVRLANGKLYNNHYHIYFEFQDGKLAVLKEYMDSLHFDECFNGMHALLGQPDRGSNFFDRWEDEA